jgi:hypothetical protein
MIKKEKTHFLSKENDKKESLLENHESQVNLIESDTTIDNNNEVKDSKFKLYETDPIKSASCISKLLFYWAFRIIKVRSL